MTVSSGFGVARRMQAHSVNRVAAASGVSTSASVTGAESSTSAASSRSNIAGSGHTWASRAATSQPPTAPTRRPELPARHRRRAACRHGSHPRFHRRLGGYPVLDRGGTMTETRVRHPRRQVANSPQPRRGQWVSADLVGRLGCAHPIRRTLFRLCLHPRSGVGLDRGARLARGAAWRRDGVGRPAPALSRNRATAMLGGWITVLAGAWFVVGRALAGPLGLGDVGTPVAVVESKSVVLELSYFYGLGALIIFLGAVALGRLSVRSVRDVEFAQRPVAAKPQPQPAPSEEVTEIQPTAGTSRTSQLAQHVPRQRRPQASPPLDRAAVSPGRTERTFSGRDFSLPQRRADSCASLRRVVEVVVAYRVGFRWPARRSASHVTTARNRRITGRRRRLTP